MSEKTTTEQGGGARLARRCRYCKSHFNEAPWLPWRERHGCCTQDCFHALQGTSPVKLNSRLMDALEAWLSEGRVEFNPDSFFGTTMILESVLGFTKFTQGLQVIFLEAKSPVERLDALSVLVRIAKSVGDEAWAPAGEGKPDRASVGQKIIEDRSNCFCFPVEPQKSVVLDVSKDYVNNGPPPFKLPDGIPLARLEITQTAKGGQSDFDF